MAGRVGVRDTLYAFISNPPIQDLNQVFVSFPKRIDFQVNAHSEKNFQTPLILKP